MKTLPDGLVLRAVESDADVEKVAAINADIHGADVGAAVRHWLTAGHPATMRRDWLFIEDVASGQAVATLCLLSTVWRYGGQSLPVAELGMVATRPTYRRRGFQRVLYAAWERMVRARGFVLGAIEGIPGFYDQFGYEYAVPLNARVDLDLDRFPPAPAAAVYRTRAATAADVPGLARLYDAEAATLDLAALRSEELWAHQLSVPDGVTMYGRTTVIERKGRVVGYVRWSDEGVNRLRIVELAVEGGAGAHECILMALHFASTQARAADKSGLRLDLPAGHPAVTLALELGATDDGHYGWQMKVLDVAMFMRAVAPTLEARLAGSRWADYSGTLTFNLYRSQLAMRFEAGKLVQVNEPTGGVRASAGMTRAQATQLWLGWRGRAALEAWYPDFWARAEARHLLDVLFPALRAFIYMPY